MKKGTRTNPYRFHGEDGWSQAFALCRELGRPIVVWVMIDDTRYLSRVYPSGREDPLGSTTARETRSEMDKIP